MLGAQRIEGGPAREVEEVQSRGQAAGCRRLLVAATDQRWSVFARYLRKAATAWLHYSGQARLGESWGHKALFVPSWVDLA